jgi:hypothetical protein
MESRFWYEDKGFNSVPETGHTSGTRLNSPSVPLIAISDSGTPESGTENGRQSKQNSAKRKKQNSGKRKKHERKPEQPTDTV